VAVIVDIIAQTVLVMAVNK